MKTCSKCKENKELNDFNSNKKRKDGLTSWCKECIRKRSKEHYKNNVDLYKDKVKKSRQKLRIWFDEYKSTLKCEKCGENHPSTLDFHHLDPNVKELGGVARMLSNNKTENEIREEISKCIILCSNCHRKLHWDEKNKICSQSIAGDAPDL